MKNSMKYDLNVGNVSNWRHNRELRPWTAQNAARWTRMRESTKGTSRAPLPSRFNIYVLLCRWSERLFQAAVIAAGVGLVFVIVNVVTAIVSGRVTAILEALKVSH